MNATRRECEDGDTQICEVYIRLEQHFSKDARTAVYRTGGEHDVAELLDARANTQKACNIHF